MSAADSGDGRFGSVIGVGASAGGVEALSHLMEQLPADLPAPVLVVLHISPSGTSVLPQLLGRRTRLHVKAAADGDELLPGHVYVAPPDRHLVVDDGHVRLNREPRENGHRPAVDATFRSLAREYGGHAVGAVLSGTRDDGTIGLAQIFAVGGHTLVQDPAECLYDGMPRNALRAVPEAEVLDLASMATRLGELATAHMPDRPDPEAAPPDTYAQGATGGSGRTSTRYVCPDCGGVLFEERLNGAEAYLCSVGHAYSPESLDEEQARQLESALWAAVRSLEDRVVLLRRLAERATDRGQPASARAFTAQAQDNEQRAQLIRDVIAQADTVSDAAA